MKPTHAAFEAEDQPSSLRAPVDPIEALRRENADLRANSEVLAAEALRNADRVELLLTFGRAATETLEVGPLVERVIGLAIDALGVDAAMIHLIHEGRLSLIGLKSVTGDPPPRRRDVVRDLAIDDDSLSGRAALLRKTVVVNRGNWPRATIATVETLVACYGAATPLAMRERLVGTICVIRREDRPFTRAELELLEICAAHMAAAIEHARLIEEERRRVSDLAAINELGAVIAQHLELSAVLDAGVRQLQHIADTTGTFLMLLDEAGELRFVASSNEDPSVVGSALSLTTPSVVGEAIRLRAPAMVDDAWNDPRASRALTARFGHRAVLAVPLLVRGEAIGAVVVGESRVGRTFSALQVSGVLAIANQLASAIVNARLYEAERRRVEELDLLLEIGRVITGSLDLEQILDAGAVSVSRMVDASAAFIWLLDGSRVLTGVTSSMTDHREHFRGVRLSLDTPGLASEAVRKRAPVQATDAFASAEVNQTLNDRYRMKSLLAVPLMARDQPIGAVVIGDTTRLRTWSEPEIERATVVCSHLAIAIANARLFDDLKKSYHELGRTQQVLVERERLAALGELAAVVAHEVRNPLGIIWNSLGTLRRLLCPTGDVAMLLEIVGEESDRLNRIVGDLLDFARPYVPELRPEPIDALLAGAIEAARGAGAAKQIEFVREVSPLLRPVLADVRLLRQAFLNLVLNAVQAMPSGGRVTVRATDDEGSDGDLVRVDIIDEGPGIPAEEAAHVFQPFYTTKATGTGLGLAVVKRIVLAHHGAITVEPSAAGGTTFSVRLPFAPADRQSVLP